MDARDAAAKGGGLRPAGPKDHRQCGDSHRWSTLQSGPLALAQQRNSSTTSSKRPSPTMCQHWALSCAPTSSLPASCIAHDTTCHRLALLLGIIAVNVPGRICRGAEVGGGPKDSRSLLHLQRLRSPSRSARAAQSHLPALWINLKRPYRLARHGGQADPHGHHKFQPLDEAQAGRAIWCTISTAVISRAAQQLCRLSLTDNPLGLPLQALDLRSTLSTLPFAPPRLHDMGIIPHI